VASATNGWNCVPIDMLHLLAMIAIETVMGCGVFAGHKNQLQRNCGRITLA
jgi:hypothetical protein